MAAAWAKKLPMMALAVALGACAVAPREAGEAPAAAAARADSAAQAGRHAEAADAWLAAAQAASGGERQAYRLNAAEAWLAAGRSGAARSALDGLDPRHFTAREEARYALAMAELALGERDAAAAARYLAMAQGRLEPDLQPAYRRLRGGLAQLQGGAGSLALAAVAARLQEQPAYTIEQGLELLGLFEQVPAEQIEALADDTFRDAAFGHWPGLIRHLRQALAAGGGLGAAARDWSAAHPGHAVDGPGYVELGTRYLHGLPLPRQVGVLLPAEGGLAAAARAIRDGLLGAYLDRPGEATLQFYPTGEDPQSAVSAYFQAVADGVDWLIGPLRRESVAALAAVGDLAVPVLFLNEPAAPDMQVRPGRGLRYALSLSQEQEARAVARQVAADGGARVLTLAADTAWGRRMEAAFTAALTAHEGVVTDSARFPPDESNLGDLLKHLLRIDQSEERKARLEARIGLPLAFEPVRRDDFDVIFLAADPVQGRQIKPQLRFHEAGDKPVFAMGRVFSGTVDPAADRDLNGVIFPTTRWRESAASTSAAPSLASLREGALDSLYALGRDAWNLLPWLELMERDPGFAFRGAVGTLRLSEAGSLQREPAWAMFTEGHPVPIAWAPGGP